jgi:hypothetical protein
MLSIKELLPGVLHLEFNTGVEAGAHFLRAQEFHESPQFRGKTFQLLDYIKWYASNHEGVFSYFDDWSGYNVPAWSVLRACAGTTDPNDHDLVMTAMAKRAISLSPEGRGYLIGTSLERPGTIRHEMAHALYHVNSGYFQAAEELLKKMPVDYRRLMQEWLAGMGYHTEVFSDETQAYLSELRPSKDPKRPQVPTSVRKPFVKLLNEYLPESCR